MTAEREGAEVEVLGAFKVKGARYDEGSKAVSAQYDVSCDFCGAEPRQPCRTLTKSRRVTDTHELRLLAQAGEAPAPTKAHRYMSLEQRFWLLVEKGPGCWRWTGSLYTEGYGRIRLRRRYRLAHRVSYELAKGAIPEGLVLDHLCRNRWCVNPEHLDPVTDRVNMMRGVSIASLNVRKTHCIHGHEFTPENTSTNRRGHRACRACKRDAARRQREKGAAA